MKMILIVATFFTMMNATIAQHTQIIAHRGSWKNTNAPQNSIASLKHAIDQKVWGTEFDVHLTKDNVLVVNHDNDFMGIDIATSTYQELLAKKLPNGESIPTVEEYIKVGMGQKKTKLIYELKTNKLGVARTVEAAVLTYELVKKLKAQKNVEYIAFNYDACLKLRELDKKAKIHFLNGNLTPAEIKTAQLSGFDYHYSILKKNPDWIKQARQLKLKTNVWTVNAEEEMIYFINAKIDYITTDEPELLQKLLKK